MKIVRWIARLLFSTVIFFVGMYTVFAVAIAFFIVTGRLRPGGIMIFDTNTRNTRPHSSVRSKLKQIQLVISGVQFNLRVIGLQGA